MLRIWEGLVWREVRVEAGIVGMAVMERVNLDRRRGKDGGKGGGLWSSSWSLIFIDDSDIRLLPKRGLQ